MLFSIQQTLNNIKEVLLIEVQQEQHLGRELWQDTCPTELNEVRFKSFPYDPILTLLEKGRPQNIKGKVWKTAGFLIFKKYIYIMAVDNTLIYGLGTLFVGVLGVLIRYGFKSKCSDVSICFGALKIKRDTGAEVQAERNELELRGQNGTPIERQNSDRV